MGFDSLILVRFLDHCPDRWLTVKHRNSHIGSGASLDALHKILHKNKTRYQRNRTNLENHCHDHVSPGVILVNLHNLGEVLLAMAGLNDVKL